MKNFVAVKVLVVFCFCAAPLPTLGDDPTPAEYMFTLTEPTSTVPTTTVPTILCDTEYSCLNCSTARVCTPSENGTLQRLLDISCSDSTPWCSSGLCVSYQPDSCPAPSPVPELFTCMRDGYFPDLGNCSRYYRCLGGEPYLEECSETSPYYVPDRQKCLDSGYEDMCASASSPCDGFSGTKRLIGGSQKYFVYCVDDTAVSVDRCIGGYIFDSETSSCTASCPHAGLFPDDEDCARYYRCTVEAADPLVTNYNLTQDLACPEGQGFLEEAYQCVARYLVPNCKVSSAALFN